VIALALMSAVVPAGIAFPCTPVAVWDGDGPIWCAEGPRLRLAGIAARELDGSSPVDDPNFSQWSEAVRGAARTPWQYRPAP
jgi:hypothetical protein